MCGIAGSFALGCDEDENVPKVDALPLPDGAFRPVTGDGGGARPDGGATSDGGGGAFDAGADGPRAEVDARKLEVPDALDAGILLDGASPG
jgi:hypothetical protein